MIQMADGERHWRFPILEGVLPLKGSQVPKDLVAGLTLAALAVPEVMGYTKIAGTPVITGLYTILIPITLFALFGSSRHLVVGADSATAAILAGGLAGLAPAGSAEWLALASLLALVAASILFVAFVVRLGFLADFLSRTVLVGFLTGVGIQVALGQVAGMLGLPGGGHGVLHSLAGDVEQIGQTNPYDLLVAATVVVVILGSRRVSKAVPGALIAVVGAIAASWAFGLERFGVHVLGTVPGGLPALGLPHVAMTLNLIEQLLPTAFAMFVVILAQSAATSRAYAARYNEPFDENLDLVGLALANVGAGLSGTFVVNGSPTKTQMVDSAGGRSQLAQITTGAIVLLVLLFLTKPLAFMPQAVLAAIVFLIGIELIDLRAMRRIYRERRSEFWIASITAAVVVAVGVEQGILLATALSLLDHVRRGYRPKNAVLAPDKSERWRPVPVTAAQHLRPGLMVYRFNAGMYYANAEQISTEVLALTKRAHPPLAWFAIDAAAVDDIDFSAGATLRSLAVVLKSKRIRLVFVELEDAIRAELDGYGLTELLTSDSYYRTINDLLTGFEAAKQGASLPGESRERDGIP